MREKLFVKMGVLDRSEEFSVAAATKFLEKFDLGESKEVVSYFQSVNGARHPNNSHIIRGGVDNVIFRDENDTAGEFQFFSFESPQDPLGRPFDLMFEHFDTSEWFPISRSRNNSLQIAHKKDLSLASIYVHEVSAPPRRINISFEETIRSVYVNLEQCHWLKYTSEEQCNYFFEDIWCKELMDFFHFSCESHESGDYIHRAIQLELSKEKIARTVRDYPKEINDLSKSGKSVLSTAAMHERVEALELLVENGADFQVGNESVFAFALNRRSARFARRMVDLGYVPNRLEDVQAIEKFAGKNEERRSYVKGR